MSGKFNFGQKNKWTGLVDDRRVKGEQVRADRLTAGRLTAHTMISVQVTSRQVNSGQFKGGQDHYSMNNRQDNYEKCMLLIIIKHDLWVGA